jgi:hypothetical protein
MTRREALALFALGAGSGRGSSFFPGTVNISVLVHGQSGGLVRDLEVVDFTLDEPGRSRSIRYFSRPTDSPLTVGLLVDAGVGQIRKLIGAREASEAFPERIRAASPANRVHVTTVSGRLYDAIVRECNDHMSWQPGRKACVLLSDGIDDGSESSLADADGAEALRRISEETGARHFTFLRQRIETIFTDIEEELRSIYCLGFVPERASSRYRPIHVGVKRSGLVVRARQGYFEPSHDTDDLRLVSVEPRATRTGGLVTATGNGLDRSNIASLLLTDGARTVAAEVVEQSATEIRFRVPGQTEAGPWLEGEVRPHRWSVVLQTTGGDLLQYIGFKIGIE